MSKINLFEDKHYEGFEWLEKAVEPFYCPLNDVIDNIPDSTIITYDMVVLFFEKYGYLNLKKVDVIELLVPKEELGLNIRVLEELFQIIVKPDTSINFKTQTIDGEMTLVKVIPSITEERAIEMAISAIHNTICFFSNNDGYAVSRINEIMDIIGSPSKKRSRSIRTRGYDLTNSYSNIIRENKWQIRSYDLIMKSINWISDYVNSGNLASLSNFTRLKCMTHKGAPIYSMEETK